MKYLALGLAVGFAGCRIETAAPAGGTTEARSETPRGEVWVYTSMYRHVLDSLGEPQMKMKLVFREQETAETDGAAFFVEDDLKALAGARMDAPARACLLVLRSLRRLRECRTGGIHRYVCVG